MSWEDVENAMQKAVSLASGYAADRVFWKYQNVNEPDIDHAIISFGGAISIGIDRVLTSQDLNRPNGQEMKQEIRGLREAPFEVEVFSSATNGSAAARYVAELIRGRFRLDSIRDGLTRIGVSPFDAGPVNYIPYIPSARFRGRAVMTIRCYVPVLDCIEYVGYIARVTGTVYPTGFAGATYGMSGITFDSNNH